MLIGTAETPSSVTNPRAPGGFVVHFSFERAVWDAYGWPPDEIPAEVGEEVILERLLNLPTMRSGINDI